MRLGEISRRLMADEQLGLIVREYAKGTCSRSGAIYSVLGRGLAVRGKATYAVELIHVSSIEVSNISINGQKFMRWMDRFFLPVSERSVEAEVLFDVIFEIYASVTSSVRNDRTAVRLLKSVVGDTPEAATILDFGCGAGRVGMVAAGESGLNRLNITGVDVSKKMRRLSRVNGVKAISVSEWRATHQVFDGAVAVFCLHLGVSEEDYFSISRSLKMGGLFAANYFKCDKASADKLICTLRRVGMNLEDSFLVDDDRPENPALVFRKVASVY